MTILETFYNFYSSNKTFQFLGAVWYGRSTLPSGIQIPGNMMVMNLDVYECNYFYAWFD